MNARTFRPPGPKRPSPPTYSQSSDAHEPVDFSLAIEAPRRIVFRMVDADGQITDLALTRDMAIRMTETILKVGRLIDWFDDGNQPLSKISTKD